MHEETERLKVALRPFGRSPNITNRKRTTLKHFGHTRLFINKTPDELACEVIQQVLKARERFSGWHNGRV